MRRRLTICGALIVCQAAFGLTTITDTLYDARGKVVSGRITIKWDAFTVPGPRTVAAGQAVVAVRNGVFTVELEPGDTAEPSQVNYTAEYRLSDGMVKYERWLVPTSETPVTISTVRLSTVQMPATMLALAQLSPVGAAKGDLIAFGTSWGVLSGGTDGQALLKDSTQARGVKWGDVVSGTAWGDITGTLGSQTDLQSALDGKAATTHQHTMASTAGIGHVWFWGQPAGSIYAASVLGLNNRARYCEFSLPASVTLRKLYFEVTAGYATTYVAWGIYSAAGSRLYNSTTVEVPGAGYYRVSFSGDGAVLEPGTYYLGWTSNSQYVSINLMAHDGASGYSLYKAVELIAGVAETRANFHDGSASTGSSTLTLPASMGAPASRATPGSGPYDAYTFYVLGTP